MRYISIILASLFLLNACADDDKPAAGEIALSDAFVFDFDLVDHHGNQITDEDMRGKTVIAYYGFTSCPDVCPAAMSIMSATLNELGKKADKTQPVFFTIDPERDTADVLKDHLAFDDRILGVTGNEVAVNAARNNMNVYAGKVDMPDSAMGYTMDHQSMFFIVDKNGMAQIALRDNMPPQDMARIIKKHIK